MRKTNLITYCTLFLVLITTLTSCEAIGDIFQAGIWVGIVVVVIIAALILYLIRKVRK